MNSSRYLILGGGMVAGYAAQTFVERGLQPGELAIVSADDALPYERPPLSKGVLAGKEPESSVFINDEAFYSDHGINVQLRSPIVAVDVAAREVETGSGLRIGFEKLLLATGSAVRTLDVPGATPETVLYLRSLDDAKRIKARLPNAQRALVIGGGFIGMEVASVLAQTAVQTTLVFPGPRVWDRFFTPEMSSFFERYYRERGVMIAAGERLASLERGQAGQVVAGITAGGRRLEADLVVAGVGVQPITAPFQNISLQLDRATGGVVVNEYLETNLPGIYAAGDVATYNDVLYGKQRRVEHWDNAVEQGKHAARVMSGDRTPFIHVPYFFSDVFDLSYEFWGDAAGADQFIYRGDPTSNSFSTWWLVGNRLIAAFVMNRPDDEREAAPRLIVERTPLSGADLHRESGPLPRSTP